MVWLRQAGDVATTECPVSYITPKSVALLEDFYTHELLGSRDDMLDWPARRVDAFVVLKTEMKKLERDGHG